MVEFYPVHWWYEARHIWSYTIFSRISALDIKNYVSISVSLSDCLLAEGSVDHQHSCMWYMTVRRVENMWWHVM